MLLRMLKWESTTPLGSPEVPLEDGGGQHLRAEVGPEAPPMPDAANQVFEVEHLRALRPFQLPEERARSHDAPHVGLPGAAHGQVMARRIAEVHRDAAQDG